MHCREVVREIVTLDATRGLVGELAYDGDAAPAAAVLLLCPHPFMGGTMDNNVIGQLAMVLAEAGFVTLRFNYAPVLESDLAANMAAFWQTGHAPQDDALVDDALAARRWLGRQFDLSQALVGYSFGCHVAATLIDSTTAASVLIAPTVTHHDMLPLRVVRTPKLVIYSNNDFATPQLATDAWYAQLAQPKQKRCLINGDHFFKQQEDALARCVTDFLAPLMLPVMEVAQ